MYNMNLISVKKVYDCSLLSGILFMELIKKDRIFSYRQTVLPLTKYSHKSFQFLIKVRQLIN